MGTAVLAPLWPAPPYLLDTLPFPPGTVVLPAPPQGTEPSRAEHTSQQSLTKSLWGAWVCFLHAFQQVVLQTAVLQSLKQEVPVGAGWARKRAWGTGHRALPLSSMCQACPG